MTLAEIDSLSYQHVDDGNLLSIIAMTRKGMKYALFQSLANKSAFSLDEWSQFLHLSGRTMQRYKKEKKTFEPVQSERILKITMLNKQGAEVFSSREDFHTWLSSRNVALGGILPKELLDSDFGIDLLRDSLTRIAHGVLA